MANSIAAALMALAAAAHTGAPPATVLLGLTAGSPAVWPTYDAPAINVQVFPETGVSRLLVDEILKEAGAIWTDAGIAVAWRIAPEGEPPEHVDGPHVVIGDAEGRRPAATAGTPLGWVLFHRKDDPDERIHLSRRNGLSLLQQFRGLRRSPTHLPPRPLNALLGRLLGRALAHEMGHYLLKSPVHTPAGLMKGRHTAHELTAPGRERFGIDSLQRDVVARHLRALIDARAG